MMRSPHIKLFLSLFVLILIAESGLSSTPISVTGDHVNLRSSPTNNSEVVGQASKGELLECTGRLGEWLQIMVPERLDLWVYDEFVVDDKVVVTRLKVRCGPGINYRVVGMLEKNDSVVSRGVKGEWRKIAPTDSSRLWISSSYASVVRAKTKESPKPKSKSPAVSAQQSNKSIAKPRQSVARTALKPKPVSASKPTATELSGLIDVEKLQADVEQGAIVKRSGVLKPAGLAWRRPSEYRLVIYDKWDRAVTICYVLLDENKLSAILDKEVYLIGNEYWIKGVRYPVVIVKSIELNQ